MTSKRWGNKQSSEKRTLWRVDNSFGDEFKARLVYESSFLDCNLVDYNSLSLSIKCPVGVNAIVGNLKTCKSIDLYYGKMLLGRYEKFVISRVDESKNTIAFSLHLPGERRPDEIDERASDRSHVITTFQGVYQVEDPLRLHNTLAFRVLEMSETGMALHSSRSNRHLVSGLTLSDGKLILPGVGEITCSVTIANVRLANEGLTFGVQFLMTDTKLLHAIRNYILMNSKDGFVSRSQKLIKKGHSLGHSIKITKISTPNEYNDILGVRLRGYKHIGKISSDATIENMKDVYDDNSIILGAYLGSNAIGTLRIVFSKEGSQLPFERHFSYEKVLGDCPRLDVAEISRLAILPEYQGTDLLFKMFQAFATEGVAKSVLYFVCVSTSALAGHYTSIGAKQVSVEIPYAAIPGETQALYLFTKRDIELGNMTALSWFYFTKNSVKFLSKFGLTQKPGLHLIQYVKLPLELLQHRIARWKYKRRMKKKLKYFRKYEALKKAV